MFVMLKLGAGEGGLFKILSVNLLSYITFLFFLAFDFLFFLLFVNFIFPSMTFLTAVQRMAPAAVKRVATASVKPATVALTQKRFNSTTGTEVLINAIFRYTFQSY